MCWSPGYRHSATRPLPPRPASSRAPGQGETTDALLPEVFAVVREASRRALGMRHFDVQMIGGMVLNQGKIAEMRTGEGKTWSRPWRCISMRWWARCARGHGQRLPGAPRCRVDGASVPFLGRSTG